MKAKKDSKNRFRKAIFGCFLVLMGLFSGVLSGLINSGTVYADPVNETTVVDENKDEKNKNDNKDEDNNTSDDKDSTDENTGDDEDRPTSNLILISNNLTEDSCQESLGSVGWLVCPSTGKIAEAVDWLYEKIQNILIINPISIEDGSPIYEIWKYCRGVTNVIFIIFLLVVIYSQLTGLGIANYGVKKALPKLIIAAILVNLSFLICSLAVDVSNIIGEGIRGIFTSIEESAFGSVAAGASETALAGDLTIAEKLGYARMYHSLAGGATVAIAAGAIAIESGVIWMLIPVVLGAIVAVATGLITIAMRQALVVLLIMVSPLAMVAYILPNTEGLFKKWKDLLKQMLVFYPMFSLLFGASSLAGLAIVASAKDGFGILLGIAVQIFPLFFSWHLMKMSGTILGTINMKLRGLADKPLAANRVWADSHRRKTRAYNMQYGHGAYSKLQRFLDNRKELREKTTESLEKIRKNEANIYIQKKIGAGYDGTKAEGTSGNLKANKYTRIAKDLSNTNMQSEMATLDAAHTISNYGDYYVDKNIRDMVKNANKDEKSSIVASLKASNADFRRAETGANNYLELSRAQMTAENDSEADFNFMSKQYINAVEHFNPEDKDSEEYKKYRHYIASSAGGLGEVGQTRVLGKILAKAAAVESNQRRDINIIANKYPHMKRDFRNMVVGYYVDDDGYATDEHGNRIETIRGELLKNNPDKLVPWKTVDADNRPYYDWYDGDKFVTRIYKDDKSAIKELFSNFDAPINDPINNLYEILAGIKPGEITSKENNDEMTKYLNNIGLNGFRTTIGRALIPFKEKNAAMSPMVAEMVKKGYIKNYGQGLLAYLDSLNKATKTGSFNMQDADAINMFAMAMDPDQWETIFAEDMIRGYLNVNGEKLSGYKLDENGNVMLGDNGKPIKVNNDEATYQELMACVKEKFIFPAAHKITMMMSKQTPNTADNQKAGTIESWKALKGVFDTKWGVNSAVGEDPYEQKGDMRQIAREVRESLHTTGDNNRNNGGGYYDNNGGNDGNGGDSGGGNGGNGGGRGGNGGNGGNGGGSGYLNVRNSGGRNGGATGSTRNGGFNQRADDTDGSRRLGANHFREIEEIYIESQNDPNEFYDRFIEYCDRYPEELGSVKDYFENFMRDNASRNLSCDEMYDEVISLLHQFMNYDD